MLGGPLLSFLFCLLSPDAMTMTVQGARAGSRHPSGDHIAATGAGPGAVASRPAWSALNECSRLRVYLLYFPRRNASQRECSGGLAN